VIERAAADRRSRGGAVHGEGAARVAHRADARATVAEGRTVDGRLMSLGCMAAEGVQRRLWPAQVMKDEGSVASAAQQQMGVGGAPRERRDISCVAVAEREGRSAAATRVAQHDDAGLSCGGEDVVVLPADRLDDSAVQRVKVAAGRGRLGLVRSVFRVVRSKLVWWRRSCAIISPRSWDREAA